MKLFILLNSNLPDRPEAVQLLETFGHETIMADNGKPLASGTVALIEASTEVLAEWLRPALEAWVTNNPMFGTWHAVHVVEGRLVVLSK